MLNHLAYSSDEASVIYQENCSFQLVQSSAKAQVNEYQVLYN